MSSKAKNEIINNLIKNDNENNDLSSFSWKEMIPSIIYGLLIVAQLILVFFFYNVYRIKLLVWMGWGMFALFLIIGSLPRIAFKKYGGIREGEGHLNTTKLVKSGIYAIIRHPYWFSWILLSLSLSFLSQYWVMVLFGIISSIIIYLETYHLDKRLIQKFGKSYNVYKKQVPRMNLIIGLIKYLTNNNNRC
ncbi:MAG: methyltransferase family protein [Candidatus Thorarchaeota archaeon]